MKEIVEKYKELAKRQLIHKIKKLKEITYQINSDKYEAELLSTPWVGNLGQWRWVIQDNKLIFNEKKATNLGYRKKDIPEEVGFEFFTSKLHPEDYERVMDNMRRHLKQLSEAYEVEYRIQNKNGGYAWYYDRGTVTKRNEKGEALIISGIVFDISKSKQIEEELKQSNEKLRQLVVKDELTDAFNRRFMLEKIENEIKDHNNMESNFSIMMLDIDDFKIINDNFGHNIGDRVLKDFVEIIKTRIRETDVLSRWGGEEFILLLPNTKLSGAILVAEDIRTELNHICMKDVGIVTASMGVFHYINGDGVDDTIKRVDDLMYEAKFEGKNSIKY